MTFSMFIFFKFTFVIEDGTELCKLALKLALADLTRNITLVKIVLAKSDIPSYFNMPAVLTPDTVAP